MTHAVSVDPKTINAILTRLDKLVDDVEAIKARVFEQEPPYGSDVWWEKEEAEADKDIKQGRLYGPFKNADDLLRSLHKEANR